MNGSSATWEALLAERAWLARLARELVRGDAEAEELAGDVLADASVQEAPRTAGPRAWLRALARRQAALRARSARRRAERERRAARNEAQPSALEAAAAFELQRAVAEAVAALEEPFRTTILLRTWENLPPREVARVMGCPVETVHSRTKRAHEKLRAALDARYAGRRDAWALPLFLLQQRIPRGTESGLLLGAALGGGGKLVLALVVAALVISASLWLAPRSEEREVVLDARANEERLLERPEVATFAAERQAVASSAPVVSAANEEPSLAFRLRGRIVADEDETPLAPRRAHLRSEDGERRVVPLSVGPEPELGFEIALTHEEVLGLREIALELEGRAPFRRALAREEVDAAADHLLDLGVLRSLRGSRYRGRVVDRAGAGIDGAHLLVPRTRTAWGSARFPENLLFDAERVGTTDASGSFALEERIEAAVAHSHLFTVTSQALGWARIAPTRGGVPEPEELELRLRPSGALSVRVLDATDERLPGARVVVRPRFPPLGVEREELAYRVSNLRFVAALFEALTDEHGVARFAALPLGDPAEGPPELAARYTVRVEALDGSVGPWGTVDLLAEREVELELRSSALVEELAQREPIAAPETRVLIGRATDASGAPARGFFLFLGGRFLAHVGADGTFRVERFPLGPQQVVLAQSPDAGPGWTGRYAPEVVDAAAGPVHFVLERRPDPGLELRFEVVAEESGAPLEPREILLWPLDARGELEGAPAQPRIEGSRILAEGTSGRWRFGVRSACGRRWQGLLEVPGGRERFEQRCALPPTGTLEIELVAGEQALPESVTLHASLVKRDPTGIANFAYAGTWQASSSDEVLGDLESPWLQSLRVRPALGRRVVLLHVDTTQPVRLEARAGDRRGSVEVQARPHTVVRTPLSIK